MYRMGKRKNRERERGDRKRDLAHTDGGKGLIYICDSRFCHKPRTRRNFTFGVCSIVAGVFYMLHASNFNTCYNPFFCSFVSGTTLKSRVKTIKSQRNCWAAANNIAAQIINDQLMCGILHTDSSDTSCNKYHCEHNTAHMLQQQQ